MKNYLLLFMMLLGTMSLHAQNFTEDFEGGEIPSGWTIIDQGHNPGTWMADDYSPYEGDWGVSVDTYDGDSTNSGAADDWLITPAYTVQEGDVLSFYANSANADYQDALTVKISKAGVAADDFTITLGETGDIPASGYTKFTFSLTENGDISAGEEIFIAFHCQSNGSYLNMDLINIGNYVRPVLSDAFGVSDNQVNAVFDDAIVPDSFDVSGFVMNNGAITFDSMAIDANDGSIVELYSDAGNITPGLVVDTLYYAPYSDEYVPFYAGVMPVPYTNLTNPEGAVEAGITLSVEGIVTAKNDNKRIWLADGEGARHSTANYGEDVYSQVNVGDRILMYGNFSPYESQSEFYQANLGKVISSGNALYGPTVIAASELDTAIAADTDPAEQYENTRVTIENLTIEAFEDEYYFYASDGSGNTVRIGDRFGTFAGNYSDSLLQVGNTYNITGLVIGRSGLYQINPLSMDDIEVVSDDSAPTVYYEAQTADNSLSGNVVLSANELGKVYIVLDGEAAGTAAELQAAEDAYKAASAPLTPGEEALVSTADLAPGTYYGYAVDLAGNVSAKGAAAITVEDGSLAMPYSQGFDGSGLMPDEIKLVNVDGLDPDGDSWDSLLDSAWVVYNEEDFFGSNVALGISYYSGDVSEADDWLILPKVAVNDFAVLSWEAMSMTTSGNYPDDYEVYVSETDAAVETFMANGAVYSVDDESWRESAEGSGIASHQVNLSDAGYAGKSVYVAFRLMTPHPGGDRLALDNISIATPDTVSPVVTVVTENVAAGDDALVQSNEAGGTAYIVLDGEPTATIEDLEAAAAGGAVGAKAEVTAAETDIAIATDGLLQGTYYAYAVDAAGNISAKSEKAISIGASGLAATTSRNVQLFPNPVQQGQPLMLRAQGKDILQVQLYNAYGQKIRIPNRNTGETTRTLPTQGLAKGLYILEIRGREERSTLRFIVQ